VVPKPDSHQLTNQIKFIIVLILFNFSGAQGRNALGEEIQYVGRWWEIESSHGILPFLVPKFPTSMY
jgi:hypothetical protein